MNGNSEKPNDDYRRALRDAEAALENTLKEQDEFKAEVMSKVKHFAHDIKNPSRR